MNRGLLIDMQMYHKGRDCMDIQIKKYQGKMEYSYTLGAFPTIELLKNKPEKVIKVFIHPDMDSIQQKEIVESLCKKNNIPFEVSKKNVEKLRDKENCLLIGLFEKYGDVLDRNKNHIVLVNPSDMGNMGTILRTAIGFGINNIAVIEPCVDYFNPKVVRSSMGACFQANIQRFADFSQYKNEYNERMIYPFMLKGAVDLQQLTRDKSRLYSLIFGNEATGLPDYFADEGQSILIRHENTIDSLNLSMAVGIALYEFTK